MKLYFLTAVREVDGVFGSNISLVYYIIIMLSYDNFKFLNRFENTVKLNAVKVC